MIGWFIANIPIMSVAARVAVVCVVVALVGSCFAAKAPGTIPFPNNAAPFAFNSLQAEQLTPGCVSLVTAHGIVSAPAAQRPALSVLFAFRTNDAMKAGMMVQHPLSGFGEFWVIDVQTGNQDYYEFFGGSVYRPVDWEVFSFTGNGGVQKQYMVLLLTNAVLDNVFVVYSTFPQWKQLFNYSGPTPGIAPQAFAVDPQGVQFFVLSSCFPVDSRTSKNCTLATQTHLEAFDTNFNKVWTHTIDPDYYVDRVAFSNYNDTLLVAQHTVTAVSSTVLLIDSITGVTRGAIVDPSSPFCTPYITSHGLVLLSNGYITSAYDSFGTPKWQIDNLAFIDSLSIDSTGVSDTIYANSVDQCTICTINAIGQVVTQNDVCGSKQIKVADSPLIVGGAVLLRPQLQPSLIGTHGPSSALVRTSNNSVVAQSCYLPIDWTPPFANAFAFDDSGVFYFFTSVLATTVHDPNTLAMTQPNADMVGTGLQPYSYFLYSVNFNASCACPTFPGPLPTPTASPSLGGGSPSATVPVVVTLVVVFVLALAGFLYWRSRRGRSSFDERRVLLQTTSDTAHPL